MMIRVNPEVQNALDNNQPVVALESTIISHGMPYPQNVKTALAVEAILRERGVIPATIGIIDGVGVVGMTPEEIEEFGKRQGIIKVSRRDLPVIMSKKLWGATTVATTMIFAAKAGIEVFVTGGIGGVHRGAQETFDISADLQELAHTNVSVVCAGAKAILDLPLTLEYLETFGVPVLGYKTEELAAFYTRTSGLKLDYKMDSEKEIAEAIVAKREMGLNGGVLIANPIPEEYAMNKEDMDKAINAAIDEMNKMGVHGKESTPFLLAKIKELTGGKSLDSNIQLVFNNAKVGAEIAKEICLLKR
ncbi:pseudouridine-5'-phosphate glycosidase [Anaerorhabdus sp.]|uniref:pseudouridine-5'-phosphate glycosidase n=1 Tax=Anaerorhabdus sp. TaxID=1872524 RepID=UPI002B20305B|nr:pseudouridine-5'-phosphate glycosidase [Anaerorhabdus sp.]MEA4876170.1 pseudouridine-5'-phosphate glycosidase [Anaerorhabdus sp.]